MDATLVALAFSTANKNNSWTCRPHMRPNVGDLVHFENGGMVSLVYESASGKFQVKFNKFQGAWGDYTKAIARALYYVLNTLKAGGAAFNAPPSPAGIVIEIETTATNTVYARWPGQEVETVTGATMPELLEADEREFNGGYTLAESEEPEPLADFLSLGSRVPSEI